MSGDEGPSVSKQPEQKEEEAQLVAEFRDGKLQIVEVTPFDKNGKISEGSEGSYILPEVVEGSSQDKGLLQLDLLNLTLVKCDNGEESYRLVASNDDRSDELSESTVTCVLQSSDGEEADGQEYMVVEGQEGPLVFVHATEDNEPKTVTDIEDKVTSPMSTMSTSAILQKTKPTSDPGSARGRKRRNELPPPRELLASPNFKLFLYSCKSCDYKCNAVKDLTKHKAEAHGGSRSRPSRLVSLQCARCPFRAASHNSLISHVNEKHVKDDSAISESVYFTDKISLDSSEVAAADVLVCGACGFESGSRPVFKRHIETRHGAATA